MCIRDRYWFSLPGRNGRKGATGGGDVMLNYEEELKKFQPSLEVEDIEEAVYLSLIHISMMIVSFQFCNIII